MRAGLFKFGYFYGVMYVQEQKDNKRKKENGGGRRLRPDQRDDKIEKPPADHQP
jgi:hypothetical protein